MKRGFGLGRGLALCLCLLCLTSCARMLEREYTAAVDHAEDQTPLSGAAYRVETYPALRAAMLSYVEEGLEEGSLRCPTTYPGNLSVDLEKAKRQLMEEDPLGCYALADVTYRTTRIISYYEIELDFTYQVDPKEAAGLPRAASREALVRILSQRLADRAERVCVYLTAYPEDDPAFFDQALAEAWEAEPAGDDSLTGDDDPARDDGPPQLAVELYPQTGERRVAVLTLDYGQDGAPPLGEPEPGQETEPSQAAEEIPPAQPGEN